MLVDIIHALRITSSRSLRSATFHLTGWRLLHQAELPGDLPVPLECHALTLDAIELQLSVADTSMLHCSAQFRILLINAHFVADNASHALASSATVMPTFNVEELFVVIRNGWTPKEEEEAGLLRRGMVYELERVLRVCDCLFCCMSATYDCAILLWQW